MKSIITLFILCLVSICYGQETDLGAQRIVSSTYVPISPSQNCKLRRTDRLSKGNSISYQLATDIYRFETIVAKKGTPVKLIIDNVTFYISGYGKDLPKDIMFSALYTEAIDHTQLKLLGNYTLSIEEDEYGFIKFFNLDAQISGSYTIMPPISKK